MTLESRPVLMDISAQRKTVQPDGPSHMGILPKTIRAFVSPECELHAAALSDIAEQTQCNVENVERYLRSIGMRKKAGDGSIWLPRKPRKHEVFDALGIDPPGTIYKSFRRENETLITPKRRHGRLFTFRD